MKYTTFIITCISKSFSIDQFNHLYQNGVLNVIYFPNYIHNACDLYINILFVFHLLGTPVAETDTNAVENDMYMYAF